ncbi:MAG: hypothetical protein HY690_14630 [Chloroflexi bacterium]|nr:hypothetical protein [Chloroflexota bacterium]
MSDRSVTSPGPKTVGYRYDLDGNRVKVLYSDGTAVSYSFDQGSRLSSLSDWASRTTSYQYRPDGKLQTATNPNTTAAVYSYDHAQRLTQVWHQQGANTISQHHQPAHLHPGQHWQSDPSGGAAAGAGAALADRELAAGHDRLRL